MREREPQSDETPEKIFERGWALTLLSDACSAPATSDHLGLFSPVDDRPAGGGKIWGWRRSLSRRRSRCLAIAERLNDESSLCGEVAEGNC